MTIAIVINTSWNIYNFRSGLVKALQSEGHRVVFIAPADQYSEEISTWGDHIPIEMDNTGSNPFRDMALLLKLRSAYKRISPAIILHFTIKPNVYGTLAARSLGIPCINNVSGLGTLFMNENLTAKIGRMLYRLAFRRGCHVLFQNQDDCRDFLDKVKIQAPYLLVPGSGIDISAFDFQPLPTNELPRFLMVGRLLLDKGVMEYLEAALRVRTLGYQAEFALAGELDEQHVRGVARQVIDDYHQKGLVKYLGKVNPIKDEMIASDWIVLPSYREGTPRTLLEAAALGRPIITTDVPGCREVVDHEVNGLMCPARSADGLSAALLSALSKDRVQREAMGRQSRRIAENRFDEKKVISVYLKLIADATKSLPQ